MGHLAQPWERLWAWLKEGHHQVGFLLAVGLRIEHPVPFWSGRKTNIHDEKRQLQSQENDLVHQRKAGPALSAQKKPGISLIAKTIRNRDGGNHLPVLVILFPVSLFNKLK